MPGKRRKPPPRHQPSRFGHAVASRASSRGLTEFSSSGGFTMKDEARNTATHHGNWSKDAKLREHPVAFVSSGFVRPLDDPEAEDSLEDPSKVNEGDEIGNPGKDSATRELAASPRAQVGSLSVSPADVEPAVFTPASHTSWGQQLGLASDAEVTNEVLLPEEDGQGPDENHESAAPSVFFFDLGRDQGPNMRRHSPPLVAETRSPSKSPSDSEEDVLLFKGRSWHAAQRALSKTSRVLGAARPSQDPAPCESSTSPRGSAETSRGPESTGPRSTHLESPVLVKATLAEPETNDANPIPETDDTTAEAEVDDTDHDNESQDDGGMDADLDDETLARLLSNDSHLGLSDSYTETKDQRQPRSRRSEYTKNVNRLVANGQSAGTRAVAQAFDELSLSDSRRNSFVESSGTRRKRVPPSFNVSDSELEQTLQAVWLNDRERKKNRKMQREEMRQQGLLGKHANPDDLRVKYRNGMRLDDIELELNAFLLGSNESIQFPPLDKHARKIVHELASKFKIKSQSLGSGEQRRPVLYRTKATVRYAHNRSDEATRHVEEAAARIHRKYFSRTGTEHSGAARKTNTGRSSHAAATYREGEIVGASVPEIAQGNKGRTILEKMGWSRGMALGSENNKGILEPVAQVVKRSKAGLG